MTTIGELFCESPELVRELLTDSDIEDMFAKSVRQALHIHGVKDVVEYCDWAKKIARHLPHYILQIALFDITNYIDGNLFNRPVKEERDVWFDFAVEIKSILNIREAIHNSRNYPQMEDEE